jgi:signal transduction histidine kinase
MEAARRGLHASGTDDLARLREAAIVRSLSDAVIVVDDDEAIVLSNPAFEQFALCPGDLAMLCARAAHGEFFADEIELNDAHGVRHSVRARVTPLVTADGAVRGGVVVLSDRCDRRQLRAHQEFLALTSHELRSPLTALGGFLEMLARRVGPDLDERSTQHLARAHGQVRRLFDLVDELTDLARVQSARLAVHVERLDLVALTEHVCETARGLSGQHAIELRVCAPPVWVQADGARLEQVLLNLLTNAVKYAPDSEQINVHLVVDATHALISVQDHGPGIRDGDQQFVFEPYFQSQAATDAQGGLGLGLYIARQIMLAHGGDLELTRSSSDGSVFCVRLPLVQ